MFTSDTARMQAAKVAELQEMTANDAIPGELICGETTRIDQMSLTGLIEKSEGIAVGTPKQGLPRIEVDAEDSETVVRARGSSGEFDIEEAAVAIEVMPASPVPEAVVAPVPTVPEAVVEAARASRLRDILLGGGISIAAMVAWYCATQL